MDRSGYTNKQVDSANNRQNLRRDAVFAQGRKRLIGHGAKFGRKQEEAVAALLTQRNLEEAARSVGLSPKTLLRWLRLPEFQIAYRDARRAAFHQSIARLQQASTAAVSTLLKVMIDPSSPPSVRVRAADSILSHSARAIEIEDIEIRVAALEQNAQENL